MDTDVLDVLQGMLQTDRAFYSTIRFLDGQTRSHIVSSHLRNNAAMLGIVRTFMAEPARMTATMTITMDPSGSFFDPIPVIPSPQQIAAATERNVQVPADTNCSICQEEMQTGTRLRTCRHTFHDQCIDQWLQLNTRCPVCRHDVRDLQPQIVVRRNGEGSGMHSHTG
jgi:hypothetical protein